MSLLPHHDGSALYVPEQAPELGDTVTVFVRTPAAVRAVHVRSTPDGEPRFSAAVVDRVAGGETWWRAEVEVRNPVTNYRFLIDGTLWLTAAGVVAHDVPDATDFRLVADGPPPPDWAVDVVVYEIFPDRFARSAAAAHRPLPDWAIPCDWASTPVAVSRPETPYQFYGGDLDGIVERLDHIADLGANTVYLTPVFPARSNHRYDAAAFDRIDPLLGGDEALRRLADAVHARGWRLIGDLTTNHTGDTHPWFTTAVSDLDSVEREFYYFDDVTGDYESWWGVTTLPKLNWASAELRRRFFGGPGSVATRWLDVLDGWRVDVANMTGRLGAVDHAHEVARLMRTAVAAARPDALLVAEHAHDGTGDLDVGGWHGTMNYSGFLRPMWSWLRADTLDLPDFLGVPGGVPRRGGRAVVATMRAFAARMSWRSLVTSWNLLGSHDTGRIRTAVGDASRQAVAAGLLMTMPGTPMVFAGDEIGLTGVNGDDSRTPYPWHRPGSWDVATLARYRDLIALRRRHEALRRGGLRWVHVDDDMLVFLRETAEQRLLVSARRAPGAPVRIAGLGPAEPVYGDSGPLWPDSDGAVCLPADGPAFHVWAIA
jgi:alpha-glucosidase